MKIVFVSNILSPHQLPLCDEWVKMGVDLTFIETWNVDKPTLPIGWRFIGSREYQMDYEHFASNPHEVRRLILEADAVILGSAPKYLLRERLQEEKLTFIYSERIFRNIRTDLKWPYYLLKFGREYWNHKNLFLLCASAFSAYDYQKLLCFRNKAYKWGYFTKVEKLNFEASGVSKQGSIAHLMWCARFIALKHPELPIKMAARLKSKGYEFVLDMYGSGPEKERTEILAKQLGVDDVVSFKGDTPNDLVLKAMREHDIFLFTSDKNEGWGAVANEAMSNGCALVASCAIGSVPFLMQDGVNGCIFRSEDLDSLTKKVEWLLQHPQERFSMSVKGYETMSKQWTPQQAAERFMALLNSLSTGGETPYSSGPCSKAEVLKSDWYKES